MAQGKRPGAESVMNIGVMKKTVFALLMLCIFSVFLYAEQVSFQYYAPFAESVSAAGDFNNWSKNQNMLRFDAADSFWRTSVSLQKGQYEYKFIANGKYWITDPLNPAVDYNNHANSVLIVSDTARGPNEALVPHSKIPQFLKGSDISFLDEIEESGGKYFSNGKSVDVIKFFRENGQNIVRFRLWYNPESGYCNLERTLKMAVRAKRDGMMILLDIHYSDNWADPGHQQKPRAWRMLHGADLDTAVYEYTFNVIGKFKERGVMPYIVQVGNEISDGFLWPDGKIDGRKTQPKREAEFIRLLKSAIKGVKDNFSANVNSLIMIHIANGGDNDFCLRYFDMLQKYNVDFDVIGLSYYPWWHGALENLRINLNNLALRYGKDIVVVETAYPWTLKWQDKKKNVVGTSDKLLQGYPATPMGQKTFIRKVISIVRNTPFSLGKGVVYWAPEDISTIAVPSAWENMTFFDFKGKALPSVEAFR